MPLSRPSTPDDAATSLLDLTKGCISRFELLLTPEDPKHNEALENRMADLKLWADGVGAIAEPGASLDSRLDNRPDDLELVKSILIMLRDFLDEYAYLAKKGIPTCEAICNVDSAMKNLAMIGVAIRRKGKASRSRTAERIFDPTEHVEFRRHLECIVLLRPSEYGRRPNELDVSQLDEIQNRLIDANLRRRHRFLLAQRSSNSRNGPMQQQGFSILFGEDDLSDFGPEIYGKQKERASSTLTGFQPAPMAEGALQYTTANSCTPEPAKTQVTFISSSTEFPGPPEFDSKRKAHKCPCCCQSVPTEEFADSERWRQHLIEDLCPYTCIAENCPTPHLLFGTRKEWESHVKRDHPTQWQCPLCDEQNLFFPSMESIADHFQGYHEEELSNHPMSTLVSWSAVQCMGIKSCPLCSSHGPQDSPELVDHVLCHAYEFSLRAFPWPLPAVHDLDKPIGTYNLPEEREDTERLEKWIREAESGGSERLQMSKSDLDSHSTPVSIDLPYYPDYFAKKDFFGKRSGKGACKRTEVQSRSSSNEQDKHTNDTIKATKKIPQKRASVKVKKKPLTAPRPNSTVFDQVSVPIEKSGVIKPRVLVVYQKRQVGRSWEYQLKESNGNLFKGGAWIPQKEVRKVK